MSALTKAQNFILAKTGQIPDTVLQEVYALVPDAGVRAVLSEGLSLKIINPDEMLLAYITRMRDDNDLFCILLALRNNANPNMYIKSSENLPYGIRNTNIHILTYVYIKWNKDYANMGTKNDRLNIIILSLIALGSNPMLPAMDSNAGGFRDVTIIENSSKPNVIQWLGMNKVINIIDQVYPDIRKRVDVATLNRVGILTGRLELLRTSELAETDVSLILRSRANDQLYISEKDTSEPVDILDLLPKPTRMTGLDYEVVYNAIVNFNLGMIDYYAGRGIYMSYPLTNSVILRIRQYQKTNDVYFQDMFIRILEVSIANGMIMDIEQRNLLSSIPRDAYDRIITLYDKPYWEKECSHRNLYNDRPSERLSHIAQQVGLEQTKDHNSICQNLKLLAANSPESLKDAAISRQRSRISSQHGTLAEFIGENGPNLVCFNQNEIEGDPYDYIDIAMAHYRDDRGNLWCVTSDKYKYVLETKSNPVTNERLPPDFIQQVQNKLSRLLEVGYDPRVPSRYSQVIDEISKNDTINDFESDKKVNKLIEDFSEYGISKRKLDIFTSEQLDIAVNSAGYNANLKYLTREHAVTTIAYIVDGFMKKNKDQARTVLIAISRISASQPDTYPTKNVPYSSR